jgi:hypothetical protein
MQDLKPERTIESDGSWHFVGAQCDRADPLDHGQNCSVRRLWLALPHRLEQVRDVPANRHLMDRLD